MSETKKGSTFIKHYYSSTFEGCPHYTAEITVDEDATISEMCHAFELFLKVSGYSFDGYVDIVKDEDEPVTYPPRWASENAAKPVHEEVPTGYVPTGDRMSVFDTKM
jgi:hypothetical protein